MSQAISRSQLPSTSLAHRPTTPTLLAIESNMSTSRVKVLHQTGFSTAAQSDDSGLNGFRDQDSRMNTEDKDLEPTTVIAQASHILTKENSSNNSDYRTIGNDILTTESTRIREEIWKPLRTQAMNSTDSSRTTSPDNLPDNSLHNPPKTSLMAQGSQEPPHENLVDHNKSADEDDNCTLVDHPSEFGDTQTRSPSRSPSRSDTKASQYECNDTNGKELQGCVEARTSNWYSSLGYQQDFYPKARIRKCEVEFDKNEIEDELPTKDLRQEFCKERKPDQIYLDKPEVARSRPQLHHPHQQQQQQKRKSSMPYLDQQAGELHGAHHKDSRLNSSYLEKRVHLKNNSDDVKNRCFGSEANVLVSGALSHSGYNLPPLGADSLVTNTTTGVHPFFQTPFSKETTSNQSEINNIYLHEQSPDEYRCSKSDFIEPNPQMSIGNCLPPMLAAAAMAALTGGRFSSAASTIAHLNPLLASASGNVFPAHMNSVDTTGEPMLDGRRITADFTNHQIGAYMEQSGGMSLLSPMRAMYNTSKLLFGGGLDRIPTGTPPPPSLSASVSPQLPHRDMSKSTHTIFSALGDMDDEAEDEEPDDTGSIEPESNGPEGSGTNAAGQQWTFEEQFKQQLYILSDDPKRKDFLDELFAYMQRRGTPVNRIPIMAKQVLDLYELFQLVVARGGLVEVINKKLWREITKGLNLPSSITSAAFTLRTQYMKYLYPYECDTLGLSTPGELQAAIDGNRREARRSSYSFDYPMMVPSSGSVRPLSPPSLMGSHTSANAMNSQLSIGSVLSGTGMTGQTSFPATGLAGNLHASLSGLSGMSLPFGVNPSLDLNAQLSQLHPLLGFPSGSNTAAMSLVQPPNMTSTHMPSNSLFPPAFVHPIVSSTGFPLGPGGVMQPFASSNLEESVISSSPSSVSNCLIPGIQNSFAAAAATLFGGPFPPTIPAAFATAIPQHSSSSSPSVSSSNPMPGANTTSQRPSPCGAHSGQSTESGSPNSSCARRNQPRQTSGAKLQPTKESDRCFSQTTSPLNLTANEQSPLEQPTKVKPNGCDRILSDNHHTTDLPLELFTGKEKREKRLSDGRKEEKRNEQLNTRSRSQPIGQGDDNSVRSRTQSFTEDSEESPEAGMDNAEASYGSTIRWAHPNTGINSTQRDRFPYGTANGFPTMDYEDLMNKTATQQAACQQLWAAAVAMQNGSSILEENTSTNPTANSANGHDSASQTVNGIPNTASGRSRSAHSSSGPTPSSSFSSKRNATRSAAGSNRSESPAAKIPRTAGLYTTERPESVGKRTPSGSQSRKSTTHSVGDNRRTTESTPTNPTILPNPANPGAVPPGLLANFSFGPQNLRIQTQSGCSLEMYALIFTSDEHFPKADQWVCRPMPW
ncbi:hypothetical protein EG68_03992 [Paragonimus skrjabini miyazakii]|uniref:ARID domain-containing protein n=1 Tax=Paragonimus skrjabini miyazakii TaxID=59628 RepID=A0A8S9YBQ8_9TREM|nr:hypothetical protein EG68_03992 [Paragonimus skrjabini miyazakii]